MPTQREIRSHLQRARSLARTLHGRVFLQPDGRAFLAPGKPRFEQLATCLTRAARRFPNHRQLWLRNLGLEEDALQLTRHVLETRKVALKSWANALDALVPNSRNAAQPWANRQRREIAYLHAKYDELKGRLEADRFRRNGEPLQLSALEEHWLEVEAKDTGLREARSPFTQWLARVVLWLSGKQAMQRFLNATNCFSRKADVLRRISEVQALSSRLLRWRHEANQRRDVNLREQLREPIAGMESCVVADAKLTARTGKRGFAKHCDLLITRCQAYLEKLAIRGQAWAAAQAAVLIACDGSGASLPSRFIDRLPCLETSQYGHALMRALHRQADRPQYGLLLKVLGELQSMPSAGDLGWIRKRLVFGESIADIQWAISNGTLGYFESRTVGIRWVRRILSELAEMGVKIAQSERQDLIEAAAGVDDCSVVDRILEWLSRHRAAIRVPRNYALVVNQLIDSIGLWSDLLAKNDRFLEWVAPGSDSQNYPGEEFATARPAADRLREIARSQRLLGQDARVPKSAAKLLEKRESIASELRFLEERALQGSITLPQADRLHQLRENPPSAISPAKLQRTVEESSLTIGLEVLRRLASDAADQRWCEVAGEPLENHSPSRKMEFIRWLRAMTDEQRKLLVAMMHAYRERGESYREAFQVNRRWLDQARSRGMDVLGWIRPPIRYQTIKGQEIRISVSTSPMETFLMGTHFNTCLSLGQCNQMSVLANAHDINKHVVYLHDRQHRVLARRLVAVSEKFALIGYDEYIASQCYDQGTHELAAEALSAFCGDWARSCNLPLANEGVPENLGGYFWYEDDLTTWRDTAESAWSRPRVDPPPLDVDPASWDSPVVA